MSEETNLVHKMHFDVLAQIRSNGRHLLPVARRSQFAYPLQSTEAHAKMAAFWE